MALVRKALGPQDEKLLQRGSGPGQQSAAGLHGAPARMDSGGGGRFVNLQQYVGANSGGNEMADKAFGDIESRASQYDAVASPQNAEEANSLTAGAQAAGQRAQLAGTWGGRDTQLGNTYGKNPGGYSQGERNLDNALVGNAAGGRLGQLSSKYGGLSQRVFGAPAEAKAPMVSVTPTPGTTAGKKVQEDAKNVAGVGTTPEQTGRKSVDEAVVDAAAGAALSGGLPIPKEDLSKKARQFFNWMQGK